MQHLGSLRARSSVDAVNLAGKTPLHVACAWGQEPVVEARLDCSEFTRCEALLQYAASVLATDQCPWLMADTLLYRVRWQFALARGAAWRSPAFLVGGPGGQALLG